MTAFTPAASRIRDLSATAWKQQPAVEMIGVHPSVARLHERLAKVAPFDEPVLITGESGVGKELVARSIYLLSPRKGGPFVTVNCPQFRDGNLTVSELFGHRKGSFTGALEDRSGCFEVADRGVIFLDEIGDLHLHAQVMLLRALATGEFQPLGSDRIRRVNVRAVAATNRPLNRLMTGEEFREDLYFRLRYFHLEVPPLRERGDDWILLFEHAFDGLFKKYGVRKRLSRASMELLSLYSWPGNIRELLTVATTGYALSDGDVIEPDDLQLSASGGFPGASSGNVSEALLRRITSGESFWDVVHGPFLNRDLSRREVRQVIRSGMIQAGESYRTLLRIFGMPPTDYQRFMDFLRHHDLKQ